MERIRVGIPMLVVAGALCIGGFVGVALGQFTVAGIDPDLSAVYASASAPIADASADLAEVDRTPVIQTSVPPWSERLAREAGLAPDLAEDRYDAAAYSDDGVRLAGR